MLADPLEKSHVHTRKNEKAKLVYTYTYPYSHPGKVISIFAVLLNLRTAACLMCSELQHRCHSLSYAGRHLAGCSQNTEKKAPCAPPLKLVCAAHEDKKKLEENLRRLLPALSSVFSCLTLLQRWRPPAVSYACVASKMHGTLSNLGPARKSGNLIVLPLWFGVVWSCR